jgi:kinesin family member 5
VFTDRRLELKNVQSKEAAGAFTFDRVFGMSSRQSEVFEFSIRSTVDDILKGYNGTVFAYGQTGAGKSYTMMGADIDDAEQKGIIPRIVEQIFASIMASPPNIEYTVKVGYMEIYMERIRDLLRPENDNLPIHEEKSRGVYVKELTELYVATVEEVYEVMRRGALARAVAATNMNQESSRSHSIFVVTITQRDVSTGSAKSGQLFLVDLAGSEKVGKTGASGQTLEEAKKINKSLSALGMVINSLTDGKSTHIPYRDSKLTRILQESLGGNSRTTLIINCSPSSYNDSETVSTLRFGVRAKSIKNKAKVNAELSVTELKIIVKKAQTQIATLESHAASLESEISAWRKGDAVPKEEWVKPLAEGGVIKKAEPPKPPSTPKGPAAEIRRSETPSSRPDSRLEIERAPTPAMERDEKEEFLRRENELQDQLAEKETALVNAEKTVKELREELQFLKDHDSRANRENERLTTEVNEMKMQIEKMNFEAKEDRISMDGLKEANSELTQELDEVKQQLLETRMSARENGALTDEKERLKRERMAAMMAGFDLGTEGQLFSDNERTIRKTIEHIDSLDGKAMDATELHELRRRLLETQGIVRQAELSLSQKAGNDSSASAEHREQLEQRLAEVQEQYEQVLEGKLDSSSVNAIKEKLADAYGKRQASTAEQVALLSKDLSIRATELKRLKTENELLQQRAAVSATNGDDAAAAKNISQQIAEFDAMKKSLMRDLQNRCERVVELEISLDETREQYNNVLRTSNNRAQQKKMAFLERNLEQLTVVQRQLVDQNSALKKEVAIAERKLIARNERIQSLEQLLHDSQEKMVRTNHEYVSSDTMNEMLTIGSFEMKLSAVRDKLEMVKNNRAGREVTSPGGLGGGFGASLAGLGSAVGGRIAKPLRGGGATSNTGEPIPVVPTLSSLQKDGSADSKKGSWFLR